MNCSVTDRRRAGFGPSTSKAFALVDLLVEELSRKICGHTQQFRSRGNPCQCPIAKCLSTAIRNPLHKRQSFNIEIWGVWKPTEFFLTRGQGCSNLPQSGQHPGARSPDLQTLFCELSRSKGHNSEEYGDVHHGEKSG